MKRTIVVLLVCCLFLYANATAGERPLVKPKPSDKCPVCGMFVVKYPDFVAEIIFKDGTYAVFDGAKDMFKFFQNMSRYSRKTASDIDVIYVTDYYTLEPTNGRKAFFVIGSDVHGPMGRELIPFGRQADAEEFKRDHKGKTVLRFGDVNPAVIKGLD